MEFSDANPCLSIIVYEFLNVRDIVNLAMTNRVIGEEILAGYIAWVKSCRPPASCSKPSLCFQIRWLRMMPTQGLDGCRRDAATQQRILRAYSARFLPWYDLIDTATKSSLFHMYRVEISESLYIGLGLHPWVRDPASGRVYTIRTPVHMIPHPSKTRIVFATFEVRGDFLLCWDMPFNQHLSIDTIDELLTRADHLVAATPELTKALAGIYGLRALLCRNYAHYHRCT
jgi:hypothetical protein